MDYMNTIVKATEFIHDKYDEELHVGDIAEAVYLSPSYFSKLFRVLTGYTVKEYVNRYRLYMAAMTLRDTNKRIIAVAIENGFSSQQVLTKKFVQGYGMPPGRFRRIKPRIERFPPSDLFDERSIGMDIREAFESVKYMTKEAFFVVGIETDIDYNIGTDNIGRMYDRWNNDKMEDNIPDQVNYPEVYGITLESTEEDTAKYMIGVEVNTLENLPSGMVARKIDTCEYAVFDTTLDLVTSGKFWRHFFKSWLKEEGLEQPDTIHTNNGWIYSKCPNFEVYGADFEDGSSIIQIYAPIVRK